jgi:hypothetical protein
MSPRSPSRLRRWRRWTKSKPHPAADCQRGCDIHRVHYRIYSVLAEGGPEWRMDRYVNGARVHRAGALRAQTFWRILRQWGW